MAQDRDPKWSSRVTFTIEITEPWQIFDKCENAWDAQKFIEDFIKEKIRQRHITPKTLMKGGCYSLSIKASWPERCGPNETIQEEWARVHKEEIIEIVHGDMTPYQIEA
jgi:hypothetical protein